LFLLSPVIGDPQNLVNVTGLPLLGAITLYQQPDERRAELYGLLAFATLSGGLLLIFVGVSVGQGNLFV
jgi:hypothetical protein